MTPETFTMTLIAFVVLGITHGISVFAGWLMGTKTNSSILMSTPTKDQDQTSGEDTDIFDEYEYDID